MKKIINFIKKLTYSPKVSSFIWRLHLANISRKIYFYINKPKNGVVSLLIGGISADFYVYTPWELRALEPSGDFGREKNILELLVSYVRPGEVVLDIGSNFGIFTILLAKKVGESGRVIAVDPGKEIFLHFTENVKLNNLKNITSFNLALGDKEEEKKLFLGQVAGASSVVYEPCESKGFEITRVKTGDQIIKENNLSIPNVIKIDVEGFEYNVIKGMSSTLSNHACRMVCCEIHTQMLPDGVNAEKIIDLLKSFGFKKIENYNRGTAEFHIFVQK
jgi:FkbM family methyltransferase